MSKNLNMTRGHPGKLLLAFALPLMLGNVFQQLYTVVDTAIVGRGVGMTALAALGSVDWLNWLSLGIVQGFTQGFSVRMSQRFGQSDGDGLRRAIGASARLAIIITFAVALIGQFSLDFLLGLLQVPVHLRPMAELYTRILMAGIPALMFYNFFASVLRAVGDSKTPLIAMVISALTNIALDSVAVFILGWGIAGAAAATVFSQLLSGTVCAVKMLRSPLLCFCKGDMGRDGRLSRDLLGLGAPIAIQNVIIAVGGIAVQSVINGFDTAFIAGYTASSKLYGVLEIAAISYGSAVTTYVGQNYGAAQWDRIRKGVRWAVILSVATAAVIGGAMILFGRQITMLFISSESAAEAAAAGETAYQFLCVMGGFLIVLYLLYAYRSALQGMGNTRIPLLSGIVEFSMRVGMAVYIGFRGPQEGIFLAEVTAWIGAAVLLSISYYHDVRKIGN